MREKTKIFEKVEAGKRFNLRQDIPYYTLVDTNWEMFKGNQYVNSDTSDKLPKPIFNIIKRVITFFIASLTSSPVKVYFSKLVKSDNISDEDLKILNDAFNNFAERVKLQSVVRDSYKDAAITGDFAWHLYVDPDKKPYGGKYSDVIGELCLEIVDGVNVYLGNPNDRVIENQPYVIITGRDLVENLNKEVKEHNILPDDDTEYQAGLDSRIEIDDVEGTGKATYAIMYYKKKVKEDGKEVERVFVSKATEEVEIYSDVDTGLSLYPVVFENWERLKNNYHGLALCTAIIPNQIFINRMFAMAMKNLMDTAFPKAVYDKEKLGGWSNQVGVAIGVEKMNPGESIKNVAGYLEPGTMSPQIIQVLNLAWDYTKETLGANDAMMGSVNPEQASGVAISVTAKQAAIPLTGPRDNMYDALECLGNIFIDAVSNLYGQRPVASEMEDGEREMVDYDFSKLKNVYLSTKVDVGAVTPYDEMADRMTYENFLRDGLVTFEEFLEAFPDLFKNRDKILERIESEKMQQAPQEAPQTSVEDIVAQMSPEMQQQFMSLPPEQQEQLLAEYMQQT